MDNKFSTIKDRCLELAKSKGFGREEFCAKIGMTYSNFKGPAKKTPLNSNAVENILTLIPDVNLNWLLTGSGPMLRTEEVAAPASPKVSAPVSSAQKAVGGSSTDIAFDLIKRLESQSIETGRLRERLAMMEAERDSLCERVAALEEELKRMFVHSGGGKLPPPTTPSPATLPTPSPRPSSSPQSVSPQPNNRRDVSKSARK